MAEFKKLSDVEVVAEPIESANVLIEENGVIKKAPKTAVGGAGGGSVVPDMVIEANSWDLSTAQIVAGSGDNVWNAINEHRIPVVKIRLASDFENGSGSTLECYGSVDWYSGNLYIMTPLYNNQAITFTVRSGAITSWSTTSIDYQYLSTDNGSVGPA